MTRKRVIVVSLLLSVSLLLPQLLKAQNNSKQADSTHKKGHKLNDVTVEGKTTIKKIRESSLPVEVVDLKEMHGQSGNMITLLNRVPGVKLRTDGAIGDPVNINLNGLNGKAIVMFKDGIPLSFYGHSFQPSLIPSNMLDRVEVYKGVLPVYLGADALGGAINFVSRFPDQRTMEASYEVGSFNTHRATFTGYFPNLKYGLYAGLNAAYTYSDNNYKRDVGRHAEDNEELGLEFDNSIRAPFRNNALKSPLAEVYIGIRNRSWAEDLKYTFIASQYYRQFAQPPGIPTNVANTTAMHPFADDRTFSQLLKHEKSWLDKKLKVETVLGYSYSKANFLDTSSNRYDRFGNLIGKKGYGKGEISQNGNDLHLKFNFYTVRFNATYNITPTHQLQLNHIYSYNKRIGTDTLGGLAKNNTIDVYETPARYTKNVSALGLRSFFLDDRIENLLAIKRYEMNTSGYSTFGMSGNERLAGDSTSTWGWMEGISIRPGKRWNIKASYEYATRMPDDFEVFGDSYNVKSNFGIKPEKSHNYNFQVQYSSAAKRAGAFNISANYFSRRTNARIMLTRDIPFSYYKNRNIVTSKGIELDVSYSPFQFLALTANGTYIDAREDIRSEVKRGPEYKPGKLGDVPPLLGNFQIRFLFDNMLQKGSRTEIYGYWNYMHRFNFLGDYGNDFRLFERFPKDYANAKFWIPEDGRLGQQSYTAGFIHYLSEPKCSISVEGNNLTGEKLFDNFLMQRPGRSISVKLRWELSAKR